MSSYQGNNLGGSSSPSGSGQATKGYLKDQWRINTILAHRRSMQQNRFMTSNFPNAININLTPGPSFTKQTPVPDALAGLSPIKLGDMDPKRDHVYKGRVLNLTMIEEPLFGWASVHLVAEDENGKATALYIYNVPQDGETYEKLGFGQRLSIMHPYMRICLDGTHGIRVDDPDCIIYLGKQKDRCRYCGEENAPLKCTRCKAKYCSKHCQDMDQKVLNHKLVCK